MRQQTQLLMFAAVAEDLAGVAVVPALAVAVLFDAEPDHAGRPVRRQHV